MWENPDKTTVDVGGTLTRRLDKGSRIRNLDVWEPLQEDRRHMGTLTLCMQMLFRSCIENVKEWNMFQIFSCHLINICF